MAPLVRELQRRDEFAPIVCATAQHREMLDQVLELFGIVPDYDLNLMSPGQTLAEVTARAMRGLDDVLQKTKPDITLVQGDTTSAMCGALASHYRKVLVGHVEAGLRTGNKYAPFPEEINRRLIGRMADLHFPPTENARQTLLGEQVDPLDVTVTGNTVIDALLWVRDKVEGQPPPDSLSFVTEAPVADRKLAVVTGHRRESFGEGFENVCRAIRDVADQQPDTHFVYPVHLNPNVREPVNRILGDHERISLIEPLSYEPFVWLMNRAEIILTDSGGVQEEAPSLGKPVLVMRDTTERPEGVEAGNAILVGTNYDAIIEHLTNLLTNPAAREAMTSVNNPYGQGDSAKRIVDCLEKYFTRSA